MKYKNFSFQLIFRTSLLLISIISVGVLFYLIKGKSLLFIPVFLILFIGIQVSGIINLVNRVNREITGVFKRIRKGTYHPSMPAGKYTDSFSDLYSTINEILTSVQDTEIQREVHSVFTQLLVSLIPVGVILLESENKVKLINKSAQEILGLGGIKKWIDIQEYLPAFATSVDEMGNSGSCLLKNETNGYVSQLSINVSSIVLLDEPNKIITFHDIRNSIEKTEIESWSKLFRVIRHEILNTVAPISSLTETMQLILKSDSGAKENNKTISQKDAQDIMECVSAIKLRSDGLFKFVNLYKDISEIPIPVKELISAKELVGSVCTLLKPKIESVGAKLRIENQRPYQFINADFGLMQQVLINLIHNSLHAIEDASEPEIIISTQISDNKLLLKILDNGQGISEELLEDIFVPFFTTSKDGSGLGLSLVRQIIVSHGGTISVDSVVNEYTQFLIELPMEVI